MHVQPSDIKDLYQAQEEATLDSVQVDPVIECVRLQGPTSVSMHAKSETTQAGMAVMSGTGPSSSSCPRLRSMPQGSTTISLSAMNKPSADLHSSKGN